MSLRYDSKVEKITAVIRDYIETLTYHHATASLTLAPLRGILPGTLYYACRYRGNIRCPANGATYAQCKLHQGLLRALLCLFGAMKTL